MKRTLYHLERRNPEIIAWVAFLWAPVILLGTLLATDDAEILIRALVLAAIPYMAVIIWPFVIVFREARMAGRVIFLIFLLLFILFAINVNWPEHLPEWP